MCISVKVQWYMAASNDKGVAITGMIRETTTGNLDPYSSTLMLIAYLRLGIFNTGTQPPRRQTLTVWLRKDWSSINTMPSNSAHRHAQVS